VTRLPGNGRGRRSPLENIADRQRRIICTDQKSRLSVKKIFHGAARQATAARTPHVTAISVRAPPVAAIEELPLRLKSLASQRF
jgi:hypothetical protein